jgi:hypothetical protein
MRSRGQKSQHIIVDGGEEFKPAFEPVQKGCRCVYLEKNTAMDRKKSGMNLPWAIKSGLFLQ